MQDIRVLVVDDEEEFGDILKLRLERRGLPTLIARNGKSAIDLLQHEVINVVILDVKMPDIDGLSLLSEIAEKHPSIAVLMLSGHTNMSSAAEGLKLGALFYLFKPLEIEVLCSKIEDAYRQKQFDTDEL